MSLVLQPATKARSDSAVVLAVLRGGRRDGHLLLWNDDDDGSSLITLADGESFELVPETRPGMRSVYHIVGPSGAGKSTLAAGFARNFQDLWPEGKIVIVSSVDTPDPAFEDFEHERVAADEELDSIGMPELASASNGDQTLLVFDDVEGLPKARKKALENFQQRALETGRKLGIHCLSIFHKAASGNATKTSLAECNGLAFFPRANTGNLAYCLQHHFNLNPGIIRLLKSPEWGRWILVRTDGHPSYILGEKRAAIYDADVVDEELKRAAVVARARANAEAKREVWD